MAHIKTFVGLRPFNIAKTLYEILDGPVVRKPYPDLGAAAVFKFV
jgi:hypothetical protein